MVWLNQYLMGVEAEWQNQEGEKNQSLSKKIVFIDNPGGHYAKPVFEDITLIWELREIYKIFVVI